MTATRRDRVRAALAHRQPDRVPLDFSANADVLARLHRDLNVSSYGALLDRLRQEGDRTPLFFYAASNAPEHKRETREHGGQGCTNNGQELFEMVTRAVIKRQEA